MRPHELPVNRLLAKIRRLPADQVAEVMDFVDSINGSDQPKTTDRVFRFPVISVGRWPDTLPLSREKMYDDDGR